MAEANPCSTASGRLDKARTHQAGRCRGEEPPVAETAISGAEDMSVISYASPLRDGRPDRAGNRCARSRDDGNRHASRRRGNDLSPSRPLERYNRDPMSLIHLVRHGQASFGTHDYDRLSPSGIEQVQRLHAHWQAMDEIPSAFYCGPLRRQRQTAELLASKTATPIIENTALKEFDAGRILLAHARSTGVDPHDPQNAYSLQYRSHHPEGTHAQEAQTGSDPNDQNRHPERLRRFQLALEAATLAWTRDELTGDFERWTDFKVRVSGAFDEVLSHAERGQHIAICTSAGVIGTALGQVMGLSDEASIGLSWVLLNASISSVLFDGRRRSIWQFNALPHLQHPKFRALHTRI
jgi:broad specificity phosphatase PhoE